MNTQGWMNGNPRSPRGWSQRRNANQKPYNRNRNRGNYRGARGDNWSGRYAYQNRRAAAHHNGQNYRGGHFNQNRLNYTDMYTPEAAAPLPGSEEYNELTIQQKSNFIKLQLNVDSDGLQGTSGIDSLSDPPVDEIPQTSMQSPPATRPQRIRLRPATTTATSNRNVQELTNRIGELLSTATYKRMVNFVNKDGPQYKEAFDILYRRNRSSLLRALRESRTNDVIDIIPDFDVDLTALPPDVINELSTTLDAPFDSSLVDPEECFKQAQQMLIDVKPSIDLVDSTSDNSMFKNLKMNQSYLPKTDSPTSSAISLLDVTQIKVEDKPKVKQKVRLKRHRFLDPQNDQAFPQPSVTPQTSEIPVLQTNDNDKDNKDSIVKLDDVADVTNSKFPISSENADDGTVTDSVEFLQPTIKKTWKSLAERKQFTFPPTYDPSLEDEELDYEESQSMVGSPHVDYASLASQNFTLDLNLGSLDNERDNAAAPLDKSPEKVNIIEVEEIKTNNKVNEVKNNNKVDEVKNNNKVAEVKNNNQVDEVKNKNDPEVIKSQNQVDEICVKNQLDEICMKKQIDEIKSNKQSKEGGVIAIRDEANHKVNPESHTKHICFEEVIEKPVKKRVKRGKKNVKHNEPSFTIVIDDDENENSADKIISIDNSSVDEVTLSPKDIPPVSKPTLTTDLPPVILEAVTFPITDTSTSTPIPPPTTARTTTTSASEVSLKIEDNASVSETSLISTDRTTLSDVKTTSPNENVTNCEIISEQNDCSVAASEIKQESNTVSKSKSLSDNQVSKSRERSKVKRKGKHHAHSPSKKVVDKAKSKDQPIPKLKIKVNLANNTASVSSIKTSISPPKEQATSQEDQTCKKYAEVRGNVFDQPTTPSKEHTATINQKGGTSKKSPIPATQEHATTSQKIEMSKKHTEASKGDIPTSHHSKKRAVSSKEETKKRKILPSSSVIKTAKLLKVDHEKSNSKSSDKKSTAIPVEKSSDKRSTPIPVEKSSDKKSTPIPVEKSSDKKSTPIPVEKSSDKKSTPIPVEKSSDKTVTFVKVEKSPARKTTSSQTDKLPDKKTTASQTDKSPDKIAATSQTADNDVDAMEVQAKNQLLCEIEKMDIDISKRMDLRNKLHAKYKAYFLANANDEDGKHLTKSNPIVDVVDGQKLSGKERKRNDRDMPNSECVKSPPVNNSKTHATAEPNGLASKRRNVAVNNDNICESVIAIDSEEESCVVVNDKDDIQMKEIQVKLRRYHVTELTKIKEELEFKCESDEVVFKGYSGNISVIKVVHNIVVAGSDKGRLYFYDITSEVLLEEIILASKPIISICVDNTAGEKTILYIGCYDGTMHLVKFQLRKYINRTFNVNHPIQSMDLAWGYVFIGTHNGFVIRYSIKDTKLEDKIKISECNILAIIATYEGPRKILLTASKNAPVRISDAESGLLLRTMDKTCNPTVYTMLFHNNHVYCGTSRHDVLVYTFQDGQMVFRHEQSNGSGVVCMNIVQNLLFVGCYNGNIYVYDTTTSNFITTIPGPGGLFLSMDVTKDKIVAGTKMQHFKSWPIPQRVLDYLT